MVERSVVAVLALILSVIGFVIIKNTVYWRIRNHWRSTFLHMPSLSEQDKDYVRIIKTDPHASESICEIENEELRIPVNNGEELVYSVTIDEDENEDKYLKLRKEDSYMPIDLYPHRPYDLKVGDEQIRLTYVNIKTYGKN